MLNMLAVLEASPLRKYVIGLGSVDGVSLDHLEHSSRAEPRQWAAKGALIGAIIGLAAGAYDMSRTGCGADASDRGCEVAIIAYTTFVGTLTGALVGALADMIIPRTSHPSERAVRLETFAGGHPVR